MCRSRCHPMGCPKRWTARLLENVFETVTQTVDKRTTLNHVSTAGVASGKSAPRDTVSH